MHGHSLKLDWTTITTKKLL